MKRGARRRRLFRSLAHGLWYAALVATGPEAAHAGECYTALDLQLRGSSFDNSGYAWLRTTYDVAFQEEPGSSPPLLEVVFGVPVGDGGGGATRAQTMELLLCKVDGACRSWPIAGVDGTEHFDWAKEGQVLGEIESALAEAKILPNRKHIPLAVAGDNTITIPAAVMKEQGISADVILSIIDPHRTGFCAFRVAANGYGVARADSFSLADYDSGNCEFQLHIGPAYVTADNQLLLFALRGYCEESRVRDMRIPRLAARLHNARGFRAHSKKDYEAAAASFAKAFELDPTFAQAAFNLACAEARMGRNDDAIDALGKALSLDRPLFSKKAANEHDLDAVRHDPRFEHLMN